MTTSEMLTLISLGRRAYADAVNPVCTKFNLKSLELDVILFLANNPTMDTAADLVSMRGMAKSHVSMTVHSLERKGLLSRSYHAGDHRSIHLVLLPAAEPIVADGQAAQRTVWSAMAKDVSPAEEAALESCFKRMTDNLQDYLKNK